VRAGGGQAGVNLGSLSRHGLFLLFDLSFVCPLCLSFISLIDFLLHLFDRFPTVCLSIFLSRGQARWGQGELPSAAGGLCEVAADGEQERTAYNIVTIQ